MNSKIPNVRNINMMPIISHIKVPSLEVNSRGKEILRAKKLEVQPPQSRSRSLSAQGNFRKIFKAPKSSKDTSKEILCCSSKSSQEKIVYEKLPINTVKKSQNFTEIKYLNEICQQMVKENTLLKSKLAQQEKMLKIHVEEKENQVRVPKINLNFYRASPMNAQVNSYDKRDNLVTFRPDLTPCKKHFRFPREVFCKESRRQLSTL